jgi:hypothetical protein
MQQQEQQLQHSLTDNCPHYLVLLQAAAVKEAAPAASSYKKSDFELYTLTTWLLQVRSGSLYHQITQLVSSMCILPVSAVAGLLCLSVITSTRIILPMHAYNCSCVSTGSAVQWHTLLSDSLHTLPHATCLQVILMHLPCHCLLHYTPFYNFPPQQERQGHIDSELATVISSISLACKQIAAAVGRSGISSLTGVAGTGENVQVCVSVLFGMFEMPLSCAHTCTCCGKAVH